MSLHFQSIHDVLVDVAKQAGQMILSAGPLVHAAASKSNSTDLVTETDQAVEQYIQTTLGARYPDVGFYGEESYTPGAKLGDGPIFVCDPVDGTVNFVHGFPWVCTSLALVIDRQPIIGVIYNPFLKTLYTAIKGRGSFVDLTTRLPLRREPEPLTRLQHALVACEWGADRRGNNFEVKRRTFVALARAVEDGGAMVHSIRRAAYAWDVSAGWLILSEAGGIVVDTNPGGWEVALDGRRYMAVRGAPAGQKELVEEFWGHVAGQLDYHA
ncbi:putative inositol monophosphatase protein [Eutypa lata UCREL1]|uniref:Inositol-1-monophosphatase n=1 Tax=Eutypa lata (strain UCR-EL1) TaxID=1287681 RepID=M7SNW8_EUTLA|nr:putative inositol monophosphatase protein [Eutypa lata UCREL1]